MKLETYIESCKKFAHDTKDWAALDEYKWYTTPGDAEGWEESYSNERGGIDVTWAFHKSAAEIEAEAPQQFVELLLYAVDLACDIDWDIVGDATSVFRP